jgi:hypothetical protein
MRHNAPSAGSELHRLPTMVRKIQVDAVFMLGDPDVDGALRSIEFGTCFWSVYGLLTASVPCQARILHHDLQRRLAGCLTLGGRLVWRPLFSGCGSGSSFRWGVTCSRRCPGKLIREGPGLASVAAASSLRAFSVHRIQMPQMTLTSAALQWSNGGCYRRTHQITCQALPHEPSWQPVRLNQSGSSPGSAGEAAKVRHIRG